VSVAVEQGPLDIVIPVSLENASKLLTAQVPRSGEYQIDVIPIQEDTDFTLM